MRALTMFARRLGLLVVATVAMSGSAAAVECVVIGAGGALEIATAETPPACSEFVIAAAGEVTLADLFTIPVQADLQQAFMLGFGLPMIVYLSAWALGQVVRFINTR